MTYAPSDTSQILVLHLVIGRGWYFQNFSCHFLVVASVYGNRFYAKHIEAKHTYIYPFPRSASSCKFKNRNGEVIHTTNLYAIVSVGP